MKNKLIALVIAVLAVGGGLGSYAYFTRDTGADTTNTVSQATPIGGTITYGADGKSVEYTGKTGVTALENLQALTEVNLQSSSYGDMVVGINGVNSETDKNYWAFYVNGDYANEGAGTYKTKDGDTFTWKLEDIQ